jgi:hypothetical protein
VPSVGQVVDADTDDDLLTCIHSKVFKLYFKAVNIKNLKAELKGSILIDSLKKFGGNL